MPPIPQTLSACLASLIAFTCAALAQDIPGAPPAEAKPAPPQRTAGDLLIEGSLGNLAKMGGYSATIRHDIRTHGMKAKTQGRIALAPGNKVLYEFEASLGDAKGTTRIICDGESIWRVRWLGREKQVTMYPLAKLTEARDDFKESHGELDAAKVKEILEDVSAEHGFLGVQPLVLDLSRRLTFASLQSSVLQRPTKPAAPVHLLEGTWNKATFEKIVPPKKPTDPPGQDIQKIWDERKAFVFIPRKCRAYLGRGDGPGGSDSLWPYRVEWWGPAESGANDELLLAVDLDPSFETPAATSFALSDDEKKITARSFDPHLLITARRDAALAQKQAADGGRSAVGPLAPAPLASDKKP